MITTARNAPGDGRGRHPQGHPRESHTKSSSETDDLSRLDHCRYSYARRRGRAQDRSSTSKRLRACGPDSASWTSRCTVTTFPPVEGQRRSSPHSFPLSSMDGQLFWSMTCFLPDGAVARHWMRFLRLAGRPAFNMRFSWIGDIGSCPFARITSGRIFQRPGKSESASGLKASMASPDSVTVVRAS